MRRRLPGIVTVLAVVTASYCVYRMIPYGLAGDSGKVRFWFTIMMSVIVIGLVFGVMYSYFGARDEAVGINKQYSDLKTLARAKKTNKK